MSLPSIVLDVQSKDAVSIVRRIHQNIFRLLRSHKSSELFRIAFELRSRRCPVLATRVWAPWLRSRARKLSSEYSNNCRIPRLLTLTPGHWHRAQEEFQKYQKTAAGQESWRLGKAVCCLGGTHQLLHFGSNDKNLIQAGNLSSGARFIDSASIKP